jgi:hypothetical protein
MTKLEKCNAAFLHLARVIGRFEWAEGMEGGQHTHLGGGGGGAATRLVFLSL